MHATHQAQPRLAIERLQRASLIRRSSFTQARATRRLAAFAAVLAASLLGPASPALAVAPGQWGVIATGKGEPGTSEHPGLHRTPDGKLHVAWVHEESALAQSLLERVISESATLLPGTTPIVSSWVNLSDAAFIDEPGGLRVFFGGQQSTVTGTPLGIQTATHSAGAWSAPLQLTDTYGVVSAAAVAPGQPVLAFQSQSRVAAYGGLVPGAAPLYLASGATDGSPNIAVDSAGRAVVAWCAFAADAGGVYVQQIDAAATAPVGAPVVMPGSLTPFSGQRYSTCVLQTEVSRRIPLVARAGGGIYTAASAGYPQLSRVLVWRVGSPQAMTVASRARVSHRQPQLAAASDGRVWVGWIEPRGGASVLVVRRSNRSATIFGAPVRVRAPRGWQYGSFESSATIARLDVVAQVTRVDNTNSLQHTVALPGLTLRRVRVAQRPGGRRAVTFEVLDAGDKVSAATVRSGPVSGRTNAQGRVTLLLGRSIRATASKRGYTSASV